MSLFQLRTPSFRSRLRLFFVVIVILPMVAVAAVLWYLIARTEVSQTDARLYEARGVAEVVYERGEAQAERAVARISRDQALADAIDDRDRAGVQDRLSALRTATNSRYIRLELSGGGAPFESGRQPAMATEERRLQNADAEELGELSVSALSPEVYAEDVSELTAAEVVVKRGGNPLLVTMVGAANIPLPAQGGAAINGNDFRVSPPFERDGLTVQLVLPAGEGPDPWSLESLLVLGIFVLFLALAAAFAIAVSRRLQEEIQQLLKAAQAIGRGDFSVNVPSDHGDEFGALGREFNNMARQLEGRLAELQRERARLQDAIRRVGEGLTKGFDRVGMLEVVVQTSVDGTGAACGRASMRGPDDKLDEVARAGDPAAFRRALHAAEAAVIDLGQVAEIQVGGASALAAPLGASEGNDQVIGIVSVARGDRAFTAGERELFAYLTNQASVSVENVDLHETVQRQAVTDELTGLFNHRRFQEVMAIEVERARRYGHEMGLIMLDIDNFKTVNDRHGHLQGDMVLREVARVLRQSSREIDEPARYGGEEMAVALPQTDLEGAYQFAERVRRRIEALEFALPDGEGKLRVTASFGVASLGAAGDTDKDALVAAADGALYQAKRSGKNRTVRAPAGAPAPRVASTE
jgi:diguanylate cyclase (GGDEF)-like protein